MPRWHFQLKGRFGQAVGGLMAIVIPGVLLVAFAWKAVGNLRVYMDYRPAQGTVVSVEGLRPDAADRAALSYTYRVGDRELAGSIEANGEKEIERLLRYRPGEAIAVFHDPDDPETSTLTVRVDLVPLGVLMFTLPFFAIGGAELASAVTGRKLLRMVSRGGAQMMGGPAFLVFILASVVCAFAFLMLSQVLTWRAALPIGLALLLIVIPGLTLLVRRRSRRSTREPSRRSEQIRAGRLPVMIGTCLFWWGIVGLFLYFALSSVGRSLYAQAHFQQTDGVVTFSDVVADRSGDDVSYKPAVKYRYDVDGREHVGKRIAYGMGGTHMGGHADEFVKAHGPGTTVTVHYDPDDPAESVLRTGISGFALTLLVFLQPFLLIGLALVGATVSLPVVNRRLREFLAGPAEPSWHIPSWGILRPEVGGRATLRARVRPWWPMGAVYSVCCILGAAATMWLAGPVGGDGLEGKIAAGALLAGLATAAMVYLTVRARGKATLTIDPRTRTVELSSRRRQETAAFDRIAGWFVRTMPDPRFLKMQGARSEVPLLGIVTADGRQIPVHVFGARDYADQLARKAAEEFAGLTDAKVVQAPRRRGEDQPPGDVRSVAGLLRALRRSREWSDLT